MDIETRRLLAQAASEIRALRQRNGYVESRLEVYDNMIAMFNGGPKQNNVSMTEDVAWQIEKHIKENPVKE